MKSYLVVLLAVLIQLIFCNEHEGNVEDLEDLTNSNEGRIAGGQSAPKTKFKELKKILKFLYP